MNNTPIVKLLSNCPLCNSNNSFPIKHERNFFPDNAHDECRSFNSTWVTLMKCKVCTFRYTQEIPTSKTFFKNRYDNAWFDPDHEIKHIRKSEIIDDIFKNFNLKKSNSKNKLLDVGSFSGKLLYLAEKEGYEPYGVEVNPKLAKYCNEKLNYKVWCSEFQELDLPADFFNFITIIDVLEHLIEPKKVLQNLYNCLSVEGYLYIKVPNAPMQIIKQNIANLLKISDQGVFATFGHINHFNVKSLSEVLVGNGFKVESIRMSRSEKWQGERKFSNIRNILRDCYYIASNLVFKFTKIPIGLNLIIVAKK